MKWSPFDSLSSRPDRAHIKHTWIQRVVEHPEKEHIQADGRIRRWGQVPESGNRYLRVILLADGETVIDLDAKGNICAMTMEHARGRADIPHFTFEEIAA